VQAAKNLSAGSASSLLGPGLKNLKVLALVAEGWDQANPLWVRLGL